MKRSQIHPNTTKCTKTWVKGPVGWIRCVHYEKLRHDFLAQTFALIAIVQPVLHQVLCSNETIRNEPTNYETHQNMSLGSKEVNQLRSFWKIPTRLSSRNFSLIAPVQLVLHQVLCNNETIPNPPKHCEMHQNLSLGSKRVDWVHALWTIPMRLRGTNFCINCTSSVCFAPSFMQ